MHDTTRRERVATVLVLLCALGLMPLAGAQPADDGAVLLERERPRGEPSVRRLACQGRVCLWVHDCRSCTRAHYEPSDVQLTDREGRPVSARWQAPSHLVPDRARFLDAHRMEVVERAEPFNEGLPPGMDPWVDPRQVKREVWRLSREGKTLTPESKAAALPAWKRPKPLPPQGTSEKPRLVSPVAKAVLTQARALCGPDRSVPVHHDCHDGTCLLVLASKPARDEWVRDVCPLLVKQDQLQPLPLGLPAYGEGPALSVTSTAYTFTLYDGPYDSPGSQQRVQRARPDFVDFPPTQGVHVEGASPYPVRAAASPEAAWTLAPTVHAYTLAHIPWGQAAWRDERDLALSWRLVRVGQAPRLLVEVDDDVVVPFTTGTGLHSDHLELTVQSGDPSEGLKLGVLLGADGQARVRRWQNLKPGRVEEVDEDFPAASGTWRQGERGYTVELSLPPSLFRTSAPLDSMRLAVFVSDTDAAGTQETLMGHTGSPRFWSEYPPSLEEYARHGTPLD